VGIWWYRAPADPTKQWTAHQISAGVPAGYTALHGATFPRAPGDFDGDGDTDVAGALGWFENRNGKGTDWREHWDPAFMGVEGTYHVAVRTFVHDFDGDGRPDIVQSECDTKGPVRLAWLKNEGHGKFTRHIIREGFKEDYHSLQLADFDRDGDMDLLTGAGPLASGPTAHALYLFENTAGPRHDPKFVKHDLAEYLSAKDAAALAAAFSSDHLHEPCIGDVNGDGTIDVILKGYDGTDINGNPTKPAPFLFLENVTGR
jgi:hypothetical protein